MNRVFTQKEISRKAIEETLAMSEAEQDKIFWDIIMGWSQEDQEKLIIAMQKSKDPNDKI